VFTARYVLSPYITWIRFVFKGLNDNIEMFSTRNLKVGYIL
jgi:hypothetical protein